MVFTLYGRELIRDHLATDILGIGFGSAGSPDYTEQEDITLGSEFLRNDMDSTDASKRATVVFETLVPTTDANGSVFREVGLFESTVGSVGSLVSRSVFPAIDKSNIYEINFIYNVKVI